jgi:predicted secreted protein
MAAFVGRMVVVEYDGDEIEDELRTKTITHNGELVNITTSGDDGKTDHLDGVFGEENWTIQLEGIIKTNALIDHAISGAKEDYKITVADLFTLEGKWQFQSGFSIGAPYNDASTFSGTLISSGAIDVTPIPAPAP